MQNSFEIIDGLINKNKFDRFGYHDFWWSDTLPKWVKEEDYPLGEDGRYADPMTFFGTDMFSAGGWFDVMPLRGVSDVIEESQEWMIKKNGTGALLKTWKNKTGTPGHIDFNMTNRKIWDEQYRPHLLELDSKRVNGVCTWLQLKLT